jgi:hypothetical protein
VGACTPLARLAPSACFPGECPAVPLTERSQSRGAADAAVPPLNATIFGKRKEHDRSQDQFREGGVTKPFSVEAAPERLP